MKTLSLIPFALLSLFFSSHALAWSVEGKVERLDGGEVRDTQAFVLNADAMVVDQVGRVYQVNGDGVRSVGLRIMASPKKDSGAIWVSAEQKGPEDFSKNYASRIKQGVLPAGEHVWTWSVGDEQWRWTLQVKSEDAGASSEAPAAEGADAAPAEN